MGCNYCNWHRENVSGEGEHSRYEYTYRCAAYNHNICPSEGNVLLCVYQNEIIANPPRRYFKYVSGDRVDGDGYTYWDDHYKSWYCGKCHLFVDEEDCFCRHCGWQLKEVKK